MPLPYKIREELQEEGKDKHSYVHSVHICICCYHHLVITQILYILLYVKRSLQEVEDLILIYNLLLKVVAVERFAPQAEDSLGIHIAALCNGTACREALCNEYHRVLPSLILISPMNSAIPKAAVKEAYPLGPLARKLLYAAHCLALLLALHYLLKQLLCRGSILMKAVVKVL